ncbi:hypothetical protein MLD38_025711 [Melastoma candidum]|uniref:Uncharacterized protein n=1 Tax=Melastoma candidum TaxID=119954 RepID=A0ACB9NW54_9MYRT|nr:hypothetical protein MLD38_025711 [Melastoma candidum]
MNYDKLRSLPPEANAPPRVASTAPQRDPGCFTNRRLVTLLLLSVILVLASAIGATLLVYIRARPSGYPSPIRPTQAISRTCERTLYPALCISSLLDFPGSTTATEQDLVHISFNMTLQHFSKALYLSSAISYLDMDPTARSAYEDCLELLDDAVDALTISLGSLEGSGMRGSRGDVVTWLSAAMTMHDTCMEGFESVGGSDVKRQVEDRVKDLGELVSNCLAIYVGSDTGDNGDFSGVPIENRRRLMGAGDHANDAAFPEWLGEEERKLLETPAAVVQADMVVSKDGSNGTFKTITEAIKKAPEHSSRRIIIYVKAGRYEEKNLKVGRKKTNLMFIGDGKGKTVITGGKSVSDKITTFRTASFAASGAGFIARDMTFENYAGPEKHQAVALQEASRFTVAQFIFGSSWLPSTGVAFLAGLST